MSDIEFVDGLIVKAPKEGAPSYVICSISIKRKELIAWLEGRDGDWVNLEVKESKEGKMYAAVDNWKPRGGGRGRGDDRGRAPDDGPRERKQERSPDASVPGGDDYVTDDIPF